VRHPHVDLVDALGWELDHHHVGRENAATWAELKARLQGTKGGLYAFPFLSVRRLQEAAEDLLDHYWPVVGLSSSGVFLARTVDEIDLALAECDKRARRMLSRRRRLRRARLAMMGQASLPAPVESEGA